MPIKRKTKTIRNKNKLNVTTNKISNTLLIKINAISDISYNDFLMTFNPQLHKIIPFPYLEPDFNIKQEIKKEDSESPDEKLSVTTEIEIEDKELSQKENKMMKMSDGESSGFETTDKETIKNETQAKKIIEKELIDKENCLNETCIPNNLLFEEEERETTFQLNNYTLSKTINNEVVNEPQAAEKPSIFAKKDTIKQQNSLQQTQEEMSVFISFGDKNVAIENDRISRCDLTPVEKEYVLKIYKIYQEYKTCKDVYFETELQ
ncbi:hypothetical protein CDIK_1633 [Cucumispora dikerogammari]|nr:hypothetical protein CDIK_1633 [Cucumispora dikerogammari]